MLYHLLYNIGSSSQELDLAHCSNHTAILGVELAIKKRLLDTERVQYL
jgi:hypothetical protein